MDCAGDGCLLAASNLTTSGEFSNQVPLSFGDAAGGSTATDTTGSAEASDEAAARSGHESDDEANVPLILGGLATLVVAVLAFVPRQRLRRGFSGRPG